MSKMDGVLKRLCRCFIIILLLVSWKLRQSWDFLNGSTQQAASTAPKTPPNWRQHAPVMRCRRSSRRAERLGSPRRPRGATLDGDLPMGAPLAGQPPMGAPLAGQPSVGAPPAGPLLGTLLHEAAKKTLFISRSRSDDCKDDSFYFKPIEFENTTRLL